MQQQTSRRRSYQVSFSVVKDTFEQIREVVELQLRGSALSMLQGLFSEEVGRLCGPRYSRKQGQAAYRAGSDPGSVLLRGQRVGIRRPRVKQGGQEVALETYGALQGFDLLCERVMKHMLCGVSTRNYEPLLDEISGGLGLSRSSVSKAFVQGSRQALEELNGRDLSSFEWLAVMIDSIECVDRSITVALGITTRGKKIVMGLREGDTENAELCKDLLQSLIERGFPLDAPILFVLDGSKALRKAVRKVFGDQVPIQRCIRHKERNALSYLPKSHHLEFRRRWKMIHGLARYDEAKRELDRLIDWLMRICPGAAKSVEEAAGETLTVARLQTPAKLRTTLLSTNPIESPFDGVRSRSARVKNWKSGPDQIARWVAASLLDVEKRFRAIMGYREIPVLLGQLNKLSLIQERQVA